MDQYLKNIKLYLDEGAEVRKGLPLELIYKAAELVYQTFVNGNKVLLCGNGGSAADCQHIAAEFINRFKINRIPLPAIALTTDSSALTAIGNDFGFHRVFEKQVEALGRPNDVLIAITTSGMSDNIQHALSLAHLKGLKTILLSSEKAPPNIRQHANIGFYIDCDDTAIIQEMHITIGHLICGIADTMGLEKGYGLATEEACARSLAHSALKN